MRYNLLIIKTNMYLPLKITSKMCTEHFDYVPQLFPLMKKKKK